MGLCKIDSPKTAPNLRHADCCAYCEYAESDNVCSKHHILINLHEEPTICDDFVEYKECNE